MTDYAILALPPDAARPQPFPLTLDAGGQVRFALRCLPGSSGLHLAVLADGRVALRCEIPAWSDERLEIGLRVGEGPAFRLDTGTRRPWVLPNDDRFAPPEPIPAPLPGQPWDIAILIDGTARSPDDARPGEPTTARALLADRERWPPIAGQIDALVGLLAADAGGDCRVSVLAFADRELPGLSDPDLRPRYRLHRPRAFPPGALLPYGAFDLPLTLATLPSSPGADYVDALADGLRACSALHWRPHSRRLTILTGDSPGHSLEIPVPRGGDAQARALDVDRECLRLHRAGVEIVSLYTGVPAAGNDPLAQRRRALLDHARDQYRRLASEPGLAVAALDPETLARRLLARATPLGRGASYGCLE